MPPASWTRGAFLYGGQMNNYLEFKKAKVGWSLLPKLIEFLGELNSKIELIYLFETHEIVITNENLINYLDRLHISYEIKKPSNAVKFITGIKD